MADEKLLAILKQGADAWNEWRAENPGENVDLTEADLNGAKLGEAKLVSVDLSKAGLRGADLTKADLWKADLSEADLRKASLGGANLDKADLSQADLRGAFLYQAQLHQVVLYRAKLSGTETDLMEADLRRANLTEADLTEAHLKWATFHEADLGGARLYEADLSKADLRGANLRGATLIGTNLQDTKLSDCTVYGISVWDSEGVPEEQANLDITPPGVAAVTVDNLKVAQFVYLLLYNPNIRDVIDTIGKKGVLILGRFGERLKVLNALREKLRGAGFVPMVFDFKKAESRDFSETVMTLAGMSAFVIADITKPRSVQQELTAAIPDYMIPFVPIIQEGEEPYSMFEDLQNKYDKWVLKLLVYDDVDQLVRVADREIIEPAKAKRKFLQAEKAKGIQKRYARDSESLQ